MQDQSTGMIETPTLIQQEEAEVENNEGKDYWHIQGEGSTELWPP